MTFKELNIIDPILKAIELQGYTHPTPIQEQSIPILLRGKTYLAVLKRVQVKLQLLQYQYCNTCIITDKGIKVLERLRH